MIIIFSIQHDVSSEYVYSILQSKGMDVVRINGDSNYYVLDHISNDGIFFKNRLNGNLVNLMDVKSIWWRKNGLSITNLAENYKPKTLIKDDIDLSTLTSKDNYYIKDEIKRLKEFISYSLYNKAKINLGKPESDLNRLITLRVASKHGLNTPDFEIIKNGFQLLKSNGGTRKNVTKAISEGIYTEIEERRFYTYTELIDDEFYKNNLDSNYFPSLVSSLVDKELEIRSFFIDGHFFSMAIFSQSNEKTKIDFRKYADNRNEPFKLPNEIEEKLRKVFKEVGLNSGSVDLILDKLGNYVFLEINSVGQYGMTDVPCNYGLDYKIANYLMYGRVY